MKKLLALVLALVMTLSLCVVSSNAAFDDAADIEHTEAVAVLNALGVINGKGENKFDPKGNVTRAEMAKMITIITLGNVDASAFVGTTTNLKDVNGHWAEAFIKYCYSQGIIAGKGAGVFDPNANVTAVEAAKMLLVAIGYNATVQEYTGSDWALNVTRDAQLSKFYEDLTVNANADLTRDQAAQMIYNAIDATMIQKTSVIDRVDGSISDSYAPRIDRHDLLTETFDAKVFIGEYTGNYDTTDANEGEIELTGKLDTEPAGTVPYAVNFPSELGIENAGEEVKVIFKDGKGGTDDRPDKKDTFYGVFNTGATQVVYATMNDVKNQKSDAAKIKVGGETYKTLEDVNVVTNYLDMDGTDYDADNGSTAGNSDLTTLLKHQSADQLKLVFDEDGKVAKIFVTNIGVAKVQALTSEKVSLSGIGSIKIADNDVYDGVAKDDVVCYTQFYDADKDEAFFTVTKAETVTGKLDGYKLDTYGNTANCYVSVSVDGTSYNVDYPDTTLSELTDDCVATLDSTNLNNDATLYLVGGMVVAVEPTAETKNYALVTDSNTTIGGYTGLETGLEPVKVALVLADGTKLTALVNDESTYDGTHLLTADDDATSGVETWLPSSTEVLVKYVMAGDTVKIKNVYKTSSVACEYDEDSKYLTYSTTNKALADEDSVFFVKVGTKYYAYNLRNVGGITSDTRDFVWAINTDTSKIAAAYMELDAKPSAANADTVYGIVSAYNGTRKLDNDTYFEYVVATTPDESTTVYVSSAALAKGNLVSFEKNTDDKYTAGDFTFVQNSYSAGAVKSFKGNTLTVYTNLTRATAGAAFNSDDSKAVAMTLDKDVKIIYVDKDNNKAGDDIGINEFDGTTGYANVLFADTVGTPDDVIDVVFVETSGEVNLCPAYFGQTEDVVTTVTLDGTAANGLTITSAKWYVDQADAISDTGTAFTSGNDAVVGRVLKLHLTGDADATGTMKVKNGTKVLGTVEVAATDASAYVEVTVPASAAAITLTLDF